MCRHGIFLFLKNQSNLAKGTAEWPNLIIHAIKAFLVFKVIICRNYAFYRNVLINILKLNLQTIGLICNLLIQCV